jgi:hypothetical protein
MRGALKNPIWGYRGSRNILFVAFFTGFILSSFSQNAGDFEYRIENDSITITGYNGSVTEVVVPEKINGRTVTAIGSEAFLRKRLTGVTFPNTITVIGDRAFSYNRLTTLTLPGSLVSVGLFAFSNNRLTSLTLPDSLVSIGMRAFTENRLKSVKLPDSLNYIGDGAFARNYLDSVSVPVSARYFNSRAFDPYVNITRR